LSGEGVVGGWLPDAPPPPRANTKAL
jgi:hypothetical protein